MRGVKNAGWLDFGTDQGNVIVGDDSLSGYAWGENIGWVIFNCATTDSCAAANYKVKTNWRVQPAGFGKNFG